jgi:hypothetical protein
VRPDFAELVVHEVRYRVDALYVLELVASTAQIRDAHPEGEMSDAYYPGK